MAYQDEHPDRVQAPDLAEPDMCFMLSTNQDMAQIEENLDEYLWARAMDENDPYRQQDIPMSGNDPQRGVSTTSTTTTTLHCGDDGLATNQAGPHHTPLPTLSTFKNGEVRLDDAQDAEMREPSYETQAICCHSPNYDSHFQRGGPSKHSLDPTNAHLTTKTLDHDSVSRSEALKKDELTKEKESPDFVSRSNHPSYSPKTKLSDPCEDNGSQRPWTQLPAHFRAPPVVDHAHKHFQEPEAGFDIRNAAPRTFNDHTLSSTPGRPQTDAGTQRYGATFSGPLFGFGLPQPLEGQGSQDQVIRHSSTFSTTRQFHVYVGDKQHRIFSHTIQLSKPGLLQDFDHINEGDLKAVRESPENSTWHNEVSQLFWRKVMEYNADIIPPDGAIQQRVYSLLCRSNILIEDLWTAHQVYKTMVLPVHWKANGEPSLLRLKHWLTQGGNKPTWRETFDSKAGDYEKLVPWIPRERLIALCILLRKGHPEDLSTVKLNGEPLESRKLKQSKTMARKKHAWIADCNLLYQCRDAAVEPQPSPYWAGFQEAMDAGQVRPWDETSASAYHAEDEAAKASYEIEEKRARSGLSRGASVPVAMSGQHLPAASRDVKEQTVHSGGDTGGELQNLDGVPHTAADRVHQLEREVAQLQAYTHSMYTHLAAHLKDFPAPPPWK